MYIYKGHIYIQSCTERKENADSVHVYTCTSVQVLVEEAGNNMVLLLGSIMNRNCFANPFASMLSSTL